MIALHLLNEGAAALDEPEDVPVNVTDCFPERRARSVAEGFAQRKISLFICRLGWVFPDGGAAGVAGAGR